MNTIIARLFAALSPDPLAPLRAVEAENAKEIAWLESLTDQQHEARRAEHEARNEAQNNPCDATFKRSVELTATLPMRLGAIASNSARAATTIRNRIVARSLEPLTASLPVVKQRLEAELTEILEIEAGVAERVGSERRDSPAVVRLREEIARVGTYAQTLAEIRDGTDFDRMMKVMKFALGK